MAIHDTYYTNNFKDVIGFYKQDESDNQVEFFRKSIPLQPGAKVLDLGCGFGRHSIILAQKGFQVTGFDQSVDYIERAKNEAEQARVNAVFEVLDMRKMDYVEEFEAVLSISTSLAFYDDQTNTDIIKRIRKALKPKGKFLYDQGNIFWAASWATNKTNKKEELPNNTIHHHTLTFDPVTCIASKCSIIKSEGKRKEAGWDLRYYSLPEIKEIASKVGFEVIRTFGDYDGSDYSIQSNRMISIMTKL